METVHRLSGEVAWVDLAAVSDGSAIDHVVAAAAGVDLTGDAPPRQVLLGTLRARAMSLVLDNCEHLLAAVGPLVDQVRRGCPDVRILATSRERLAVDGEWVLPVGPLSTRPTGRDGTGDATRLFAERAAAVAPAVNLTRSDPVIAEVCDELDGLPLAIELAAARIGAMSVEDLLTGMRDGLPAAGGHRRGGHERHRTLQATLDWSYRLLPDDQRRLFERLSVFAADFGVAEAHAVCAPDGEGTAATAEGVAMLAEKSMLDGPLVRGPGRSARYRMLRTMRRFAAERLSARGEAGAMAARQAAAFAEYAERVGGPPLDGDGLRRLELALPDLRQAHRWARERQDLDLAARLTAALYRFAYWRPGAEPLTWAAQTVTMGDVERHPAAPQIHAAAAVEAWTRGDLARAGRLAHRGSELGSGPGDPARTLAFEAVGDVANFEGRLEDAVAAYGEEVRLARLAGDPDSEVTGLGSLALVLGYSGRRAEAIDAASAAHRAGARAGAAARAFARYTEGECRAEREPGDALAILDEAGRLADECGAWFVQGVARLTAASLRGRHGDPMVAVPAFADLIRFWQRSGSWTQQWTTLRNYAELLVRVRADERAVEIATACDVAEQATPQFGDEAGRLGAALAVARDRLGRRVYDAAAQRGRRLQAGEVVGLALATADACRLPVRE